MPTRVEFVGCIPTKHHVSLKTGDRNFEARRFKYTPGSPGLLRADGRQHVPRSEYEVPRGRSYEQGVFRPELPD
jgi:hypothetical protein